MKIAVLMLFLFLKCILIFVFIFRPWKAEKWLSFSPIAHLLDRWHRLWWCFVGFGYGWDCSICQEKKMFKSSSTGIIQSNCLSEVNYVSRLFFFKLGYFSLYQSSRVVIEQHHETIYCTVEKPATSQTHPGNNTVSNNVETIYDTPSRHVCNI